MNVREWKAKHRKEIVLKSGLKVTVRRMSPWAVSEIGPIPGMDTVQEMDQNKLAKAILFAGIVSPRLGEGEDEISLLDLDAEDTATLVDAIVGVQVIPREDGVPLASTASPEAPQ